MHAEATGAAGLRTAGKPDLALTTLDLAPAGHQRPRPGTPPPEASNAPLLMITAAAEPGDELDGIASGAAAYLTKPFSTARLRELVQQLCPREPRHARNAPIPDRERSRGQDKMHDTSTLAFHLTYAGTLGMAFLMFLGQPIAFTALLAFAAAGRLLFCAVRGLIGRLFNSPDPQPQTPAAKCP